LITGGSFLADFEPVGRGFESLRAQHENRNLTSQIGQRSRYGNGMMKGFGDVIHEDIVSKFRGGSRRITDEFSHVE
jgi:hypothetical protein